MMKSSKIINLVDNHPTNLSKTKQYRMIVTLPKGYKPSGEKIEKKKSFKDYLKLIGLIAAVGSIFAFGAFLEWLLNR